MRFSLMAEKKYLKKLHLRTKSKKRYFAFAISLFHIKILIHLKDINNFNADNVFY